MGRPGVGIAGGPSRECGSFAGSHQVWYYYRIPVLPIYKSYPVYAPGKEPAGYWERLQQLEPDIAFDPDQLTTEDDWIKAGEIVFDAPRLYDVFVNSQQMRDGTWYRQSGIAFAADGTVPYFRYFIRNKGKVEIGNFSCANCHTRVMPNGTVIKGAQGNVPFERMVVNMFRSFPPDLARGVIAGLYSPPVSPGQSRNSLPEMKAEEVYQILERIPPGVVARHRASYLYPVQVPDLIGIRDRKYLDRTGLQLHRNPGDLMRYAALNQGGDDLARYGRFCPQEAMFGAIPDPAVLNRYSDEQLYSLTQYLYSLKPPSNPNRFNGLAARGQRVFQKEGCAGCHTPPLYTNNKLIPATGFTVPKDHSIRFDILSVELGTDPDLTMKTRRGTGYYKVPSLRGVWYRGPFEHSGSVATLEDWFDANRLRSDYVPTGFRAHEKKPRAVRGHNFGLTLSVADKAALIAFLKTL